MIKCGILLLYYCSFSLLFSQEKTGVHTDTIHINDIKIIYQFCEINNSHYKCGRYQEYDSIGNLLTSGQYQVILDSLPCIYCFTLVDSTLIQFFYTSSPVCVKSGIWTYYYPNGIICSEGSYCSKTRIEGVSSAKAVGSSIYDSGPVGHHSVDLKEGRWKYYSDDGKLIREEWYVDGTLVWVVQVH